MTSSPRHLTYHPGQVARAERERRLGQRGCVVWLTGLSGSGKSTLARALERRLADDGHLAYVLDGDNLRHGLCADLGFSAAERDENLRRAAEVAALLADAGLIVLAAFIAPGRAQRERARAVVGPERFREVWVDAPLEVCSERDPKGLYARAQRGEIAEFTGVSAPYEPPVATDLVVRTAEASIADGVAALHRLLAAGGFLAPPPEEA